MKPIILTIFLLALVGCGKRPSDEIDTMVADLNQIERELVQMQKMADVIIEALAENHRRNQTNQNLQSHYTNGIAP